MSVPQKCNLCNSKAASGIVFANSLGDVEIKEFCKQCVPLINGDICCLGCLSVMSAMPQIRGTERVFTLTQYSNPHCFLIERNGVICSVFTCSEECKTQYKQALGEELAKRGVQFGYTCQGCDHTDADLKRCSSCKMARYCSKECQVKDWSRHKSFCISHRSEASKIVDLN